MEKRSTVLAFILLTNLVVSGRCINTTRKGEINSGAEINFDSCEDESWTPYKDEHCVKLFKTFLTRTQAQDQCRQESSSLVTIKSADEQLFLNEYVFHSSDSNNVWIGAERRPGSETDFVWVDGSPVQRFTNWRIGSPSNIIGRGCVQMQTKYSRQLSDLEWVDVSCNGGASWFICQKLQTWSIGDLQRAILATRQEMQSSVESLTTMISDMKNLITDMQSDLVSMRSEIRSEVATVKTEMNNSIAALRSEITTMRNNLNSQMQSLQSNPVPVGFIYVQLSGQSEPRHIWPTVSWTEVTSQYAGLFFRAQGGGSAGFGSVQQESSPRMTQIDTTWINGPIRFRYTFPSTSMQYLTIGRWSNLDNVSSNWALMFTQSTGEVRPRNSAIRIWRRNS